MDIRYKYKQLLEGLFSSKSGLQLYTIHRRFNLKPSSVVEFVNEYSGSGIISVIDNSTIVLTHKGRDNFRRIITDLLKEEDLSSLKYLDMRLYTPMEKFAPYIPTDIIIAEMRKPELDVKIDFPHIPF